VPNDVDGIPWPKRQKKAKQPRGKSGGSPTVGMLIVAFAVYGALFAAFLAALGYAITH
jgi:hypothetical protein